MEDIFTSEMLKSTTESVKRQIRPIKIGGHEYYFGLVHPDWLRDAKLAPREKYKLEAQGKRLAKRLESENEGFIEKLKVFGEDIRMIRLKA